MTPEEWRRNEAHRWLAVASRDLHGALLLAKEEPTAQRMNDHISGLLAQSDGAESHGHNQ